MKQPYEAREAGSDNRPYVEGPGNGMGYHSGTIFRGMRLSTTADAEAAARIANEAYRQGVFAARAEMRIALGLGN